MKQLTFNILNHTFQIGIAREDKKRFSVAVGDNTFQGTIEDDSENALLVAVEGVIYNIEIAQKPKQGEFSATVNSRQRTVVTGTLPLKSSMDIVKGPDLKEKDEIPEEEEIPATGISGGILAPMPGKVVKVNVNVGDVIKSGDVVLILEAMKMENEICANRSGTVREIHVSAGDSVDSNDVLIVIE